MEPVAGQTLQNWLRHPSLSSSTYIIHNEFLGENNRRTVTLSAVNATFGAGTPVQFMAGFDVLESKLMSFEWVFRPVSQLYIRAGIQRMPYLLETSYSPRILEAIGFSQATSYLGGYSRDLSGKNSRSRDCGIALEGTFLPRDGYHVVNVVLGVFNGNGYSFADDNKPKDVHGRVVFQPLKTLKFSLGGMTGRYGEDCRLRQRLSAGVWYDNGKYFLRSENIFGYTNGLSSDGISALAGVWFKESMALSARLDRFQKDLTDSQTSSTKVELCFTHMLVPSRDISYRIQYGYTFMADPALKDINTLALCLICRFSTTI